MSFEGLLNKTVKIKRAAGTTLNEYREVVTNPIEEVATIKMRINASKSPGLTREFQGQVVYIEAKGFCLPTVEIKESDYVINGSRQYQVIKVNEIFEHSLLHHYELELRRLQDLT